MRVNVGPESRVRVAIDLSESVRELQIQGSLPETPSGAVETPSIAWSNALELAGDSLDERYMTRWIGALGLQEDWERVKKEV